MKNLNEYISESVLSGEDAIVNKALPHMILSQFNKSRKYNGKPIDGLGRDLQEGDLVIGVDIGSCNVGMIEKIRGGNCAVRYGERSTFKRTADGDIPTRIQCASLLKITPEIAELILRVK